VIIVGTPGVPPINGSLLLMSGAWRIENNPAIT
jgi:hypothetical protein